MAAAVPRNRLRTESSFGMPVSPYVPGCQAGCFGVDAGATLQAGAAGMASPRMRLRTESSFGMPVSPYAPFGGDPMDYAAAAYMGAVDPSVYMNMARHRWGAGDAAVARMQEAAWMASAPWKQLPPGGAVLAPVPPMPGAQPLAATPGGYPAAGLQQRPEVQVQRLQLTSLVGKPGGKCGGSAPQASPAPQQRAPTRGDQQAWPSTATRGQKMRAVVQQPTAAVVGGPRTTVMLRGLPVGMTRAGLLELLDAQGFAEKYDFAYLPVDFDTLSGLSHAFVNVTIPEAAEQIRMHFEGFSDWPTPSDSVCHVAWNDKQQGLPALVERYRNSPVMHASVPEECKPVIISDGRRAPFPAPTQKVKAPKIGKSKA